MEWHLEWQLPFRWCGSENVECDSTHTSAVTGLQKWSRSTQVSLCESCFPEKLPCSSCVFQWQLLLASRIYSKWTRQSFWVCFVFDCFLLRGMQYYMVQTIKLLILDWINGNIVFRSWKVVLFLMEILL